MWNNIPEEIVKVDILSKLKTAIQKNYNLRQMLVLVSKVYRDFIYQYFDLDINEIMNTPIELRAQIGYFNDARGQDDVEYLVGPLKIYSYHNTIETAIKELPENYSGRDNHGSMRSYESVIMNNIKLGEIFGSERLVIMNNISIQLGLSSSQEYISNIDMTYDNHVIFYRNILHNNRLFYIEETKDRTARNEFSCYSDIYWLYVLEIDGYYFKSFAYTILPYYDENITSYGIDKVIKVFQITTNVEFELPDLDMNEND